jgi:dTDP-glucose 4,6-dehydratase
MAVPPLTSEAPRRVVVSGGAGFVGSWLCESLLERGDDVTCVDNLLTGSLGNVEHLLSHRRFRFVDADVCEPLPVDSPVDVVLHLASPASPRHYLDHPVETLRVGSAGTLALLELARRHEARFVLASTSEVYGDPAEHPQHEDYWGHVNPNGPRSVYDEAKRFSEAATMAYRRTHGVDTGIVRIFNTYGPRMSLDDGRAIPQFVGQALRGEPLTVAGDGSQTRSLCYVTDTVAGLIAMSHSDHPGPINIGNPEEVTVLELAHQVVDVCGSSSPVHHVELPVDDPRRRCPDVGRAREVLGWRPTVGREEGLPPTVEWFEEQVGRSADVGVMASAAAAGRP